MDGSKPYEAPSLATTVGDESDSSVESRRVRFLRAIYHLAINVVIVAAFTGLVAVCLLLFMSGYRWTVGGGVLLGIMVAALFFHDQWHMRIAISLSVPFFAIGGAVGMNIYFKMFSLPWFEAAFNDKGAGEFGLLIFVCGFALAVGLTAGYCIHSLIVKCFHVADLQQAPPAEPPTADG